MPAPRPTTASPRPLLRHPTALAAAACLLSFGAFWISQRAAGVSMIDLLVYRAEGQAVRTGADLYAMAATRERLPATYPPFAAWLFTPLAGIGVPALRTAATAANLLLLLVVVHLSLRLAGRGKRCPRPAATAAVAALAVWCEPVWTTLRYGQINLLIAALVLWDLTRPAGSRLAGAGIGVAAGIKLTPALFAVHLAAVGAVRARQAARRGRPVWNPALRQAATAAAVFAGTAAAAAVAMPRDSRSFWTRVVFAAGRVGRAEDTGDQSLRGVLARVLHSPDPAGAWLPAAAATAVLGLAVAAAAALAGDRLPAGRAWAAGACAATALLVSPISWSHHWVWAVPMVLTAAREARRRGSRWWGAGTAAAAGVFLSYAPWLVPHGPSRPELRQGPLEMLLSAAYPVAAAGFLATAAVLAVGALRPAADRSAGISRGAATTASG